MEKTQSLEKFVWRRKEGWRLGGLFAYVWILYCCYLKRFKTTSKQQSAQNNNNNNVA